MGAGVGASVGSVDQNELHGGIVGAITGAAFGGLMGYLFHHEEEKQKALEAQKGHPDSTLPDLTRPVVRRVWIPDRIEAEQFVKGHFVYQIEKPSVWSSPDDK